MSLGIAIKGPEGLILAAESRVTLSTKSSDGQIMSVNFDNATKLLSFSAPNTAIGVVTYGQAAIGLRTPSSFITEFEAGLPKEKLTVLEFANRLSEFMSNQWNSNMPPDYKGMPMTFIVGGFNENEAYGRIYSIDIPHNPKPIEQCVGQQFGMSWGGQREVVDRLTKGYDFRLPELLKKSLNLTEEQQNILKNELVKLQMQIPFQFLPLQDCVDLAVFFIKTTINAQKLTIGIRGCGGYIDVATITRNEGLKFIQRKIITGEQQNLNILLKNQ